MTPGRDCAILIGLPSHGVTFHNTDIGKYYKGKMKEVKQFSLYTLLIHLSTMWKSKL